MLSLVAGLFLTSQATVAAPRLALTSCEIPGFPGKAQCATYEVFENRAARTGRKIGLKLVVLPAAGPGRAPDPLFFFAGGPGDAATRMAAGLARAFAEVLKRHDIVLVDQRGTGGSHGLHCELFDRADLQGFLGDFFPPEAVKKCRAELEKDADLTQYTTSIAMDDIDDVRAALGYERINLWGGSYGTRAALVYLRRHGEHVRTATLMGVAPTTDPMPLHFARDAQRALDGVLADCEAEAACGAAFPKLKAEVAAVFERLGKGPASVEVLHPQTGEPKTVRLSRDLVAEALRYLMYSSGTAGLIPALLHRAAQGDFGPLAEFALFGRQAIVGGLGTGLYLSITCAEDLPWIQPLEGEREARGTFLGDYRLVQQRRACALWPQAKVPPSDLAPVEAKAPVLILSGQWDPATPPALGEQTARHLPNSRHVVVPHGGHDYDGLEGLGCVQRLQEQLIERGSTEALDTACVADVKRRPFPTTLPPMKPITLPEAHVAKLAGRYLGDGAPIEASVEARGGRLAVTLPGAPSFLLVPVAPERFRVVGYLGMYVVFELEAGKVKRLVLEENGEATLALKPAAQ